MKSSSKPIDKFWLKGYTIPCAWVTSSVGRAADS